MNVGEGQIIKKNPQAAGGEGGEEQYGTPFQEEDGKLREEEAG